MSSVQELRHEVRDSAQAAISALAGVPGLSTKDQDKRAKTALASLREAVEAAEELRATTKARKKD